MLFRKKYFQFLLSPAWPTPRRSSPRSPRPWPGSTSLTTTMVLFSVQIYQKKATQLTYQSRNIYIFLQLDNAMIRACRVNTWSTFKGSGSPQKSPKVSKVGWKPKNVFENLFTVLYKNTEKYRYFIFKNTGIGIWVKSRYTAGACPPSWIGLICSFYPLFVRLRCVKDIPMKCWAL